MPLLSWLCVLCSAGAGLTHPSGPSRSEEALSERPLPIEPDGLFDGLRWSLILRGAVMDNVLTLIASLPILFFFAGADAFSDDEKIANQAIDQATVTPEFLACVFIVGLSITVYASFWAARRAGVLHTRHGGWTAVTSAVLGSMLLLAPGATTGPSPPYWYDAVSLALMIPAGVMGGWLAARAAS